MKKIVAILLLALQCAVLSARTDSYAVLWKQYEAAQEKDLPKTSIAVLNKIIRKAQTEKRYGHLLKAELESYALAVGVAPDSLLAEVRKMEGKLLKADAENPVLAAVYRSVIGRIYRDNSWAIDNADSLSNVYYRQSLANVDLLAAQRTSDYVPLVMEGIDSRIFNNDLLHVLGMEAEDYRLLHAYYRQHGNRAAACLSALKAAQKHRRHEVMMVRKSKYLQTVDSLINEYKDLVEAGELAIERYRFMDEAEDASAESKMKYINYALLHWGAWPRMNILRNAQTHLTLPNFHVSLEKETQIPYKASKVIVMQVCNIQQLTMTVWPLKTKTNLSVDVNTAKGYAKAKALFGSKTPEYTETKRYIGLPNYQITRDSMTIKGLPAGIYLVEITTDNRSIKPQRTLLHVSDVYVMAQPLPEKQIRLVAVSATSGQPLPAAKIRLTTDDYNSDHKKTETLTCNDRGEAVYTYGDRIPDEIYPYTSADPYCPVSRFNAYGSFPETPSEREKLIDLYTDRAIYRPGQTVHAAAIMYSHTGGEQTGVMPDQPITLTLRDTNSRVVTTKKVQTDAYGTASADFVLPPDGLTGVFTLQAEGNANGITRFSVEEYKRPTFQITFDEVKQNYRQGDTVSVSGRVESFAGVPVQGAKVIYNVTRKPAFWWRDRWSKKIHQTLSSDTVVSDQDGRFIVPVTLTMPADNGQSGSRYCMFSVKVDVTDIGGESHSAETTLPLSDKPTALTCSLPELIVKDSLRNVTFNYINNAGQPVEGQVTYTVDGHSFTAKTNQPTSSGWQNLPSGRHRLLAICGNDTIDREFIVFSFNDKKPPVGMPAFFGISERIFPADGKPVTVLLGSADQDVHVVYTMIADKQIIESGSIGLSDELVKQTLSYQPQYGNGLLVNYAWVKDGVLHRYSAYIRKPERDTRLLVSWKTFRNRLVPGQQEEWVLQIKKPDGTPAQAQLLSVMFDKTLNELTNHDWSFGRFKGSRQPFAPWVGPAFDAATLYGDAPFTALHERPLNFSRITDVFTGVWSRGGTVIGAFDVREQRKSAGAVPMFAMAKSENEMLQDDNLSTKASGAFDSVSSEQLDHKAGKGVSPEKEDNPVVRENLNETAFFFPSLLTDMQGDIKLKFTLPESVTTWQFMALAHDKDVNYGLLKDEIVAQKTVMIQPNVPRFVRSSDRSALVSRVFNTSDRRVSGVAMLELIDPETEKSVFSQRQHYEIAPRSSVSVTFSFDMRSILARRPSLSLLVLKITANGKDYSDGEQHYLPVLPEKELVTTTVPFTQNGPGMKTIDLKTLFPVKEDNNKLTVEYTDNPAWLMVQALSAVSLNCEDNAIGLSAAYYADAIGRHLLNESPLIKSTIDQWKQEKGAETSLMSNLQKNQSLKTMLLEETPWVAESNKESEQKQQLINFFDSNSIGYRMNSVLQKLQTLQNPNGSFSWWKGMPGSRYMTTEVTKMMIRLNMLIGKQPQTERIIRRAMSYLDKEAAREVRHIKKMVAEHIKNIQLDNDICVYLYINALTERRPTADMNYLIEWLTKSPRALTIYGKANTAVILSHYGKAALAKEYLQSVSEYTVYREEMGRYFDTPKAQYSWFDYRIPSQVAAIEAMKRLTPGSRDIEEMKRWLLQSKRTQAWDTPINSVNAVYAFLHGEMQKLQTTEPSVVIKIDNRPIVLPKATAGLGYVKTSRTGKGMKTLTVDKTSAGTSWGAVYAQFMQKTAEVAEQSSGLRVTRTLLHNGKPADNLKVGDRLTVRITIEADRDYDFVQLQDKRAACLEPAEQISGYYRGYYCAPKDHATNYYFDTLRKGKHTIETEYYIDRAGTYQMGTCTIQCAYSPEYNGRTAAKTLNIKK